MAYPTIYDECWDGAHSQCQRRGRDKLPPGVCGGGFCICECHWDPETINQPWIDEVRASVKRSREANVV